MTERNGLDAESSQGREMDTVNSSHEQGIQGYFGPSIRQAVSQYQGLLREGLEREVQRIIYEVESATVDIESTIAKRIKSRLKGLVQDEVRRIFDDALSNAENSLIEPPLGREWKMRSDSIGQRRQSNVVKDEESVPHDSGAENDDHSDWSEGSHVETPPQPVDPSPTTGEREAGGDYEIAEPPLPPGQPLTAREPVNYQNLETEPGNQESSVPSDEARNTLNKGSEGFSGGYWGSFAEILRPPGLFSQMCRPLIALRRGRCNL